jgi:hypothetical protein
MILKKPHIFSENDAFIRIYLDNKKQKQNTTLKHDTKTAQWNQTFILHKVFFILIKYFICLAIICQDKIFFILMLIMKIQ